MNIGRALPCTAVALLLFGCGGGGGAGKKPGVSAGVSTVAVVPALGVVADGVTTATVTVTALTAGGNPVKNKTVTIAVTGSNNTVVQPAATTDGTGVATATIASTTAETKTITATVDPGPKAVVLTTTPTVEFVGDPATISAGLSTVSAVPATGVIADDVETSTLSVVVRDVNGNAVAGQTVQLAATGSNNTITQPGAPTDAGGAASGTISSITAETKTVTATVNPGPGQVVLTTTPTVDFVGDPGNISAALSTVSAVPATGVIADDVDASTVSVVVRDVNGNPVAGQTVFLTATGDDNTITQPAAVTDATGAAAGTIATITAETKTVTVLVDPGPGQVALTTEPTVDFVGDPANVSAALSTVSAVPATGVIADDVDASTVSVVVRDVNGNPVAGQTVQLSATGSNNTITQPGGPTDASGAAAGTISSITAETKTVTVTVDPGPGQVVLTTTPTVDFVGDPATISAMLSTVTATPAFGVLADGVEVVTVTVTVLDANSNPVPGRTVQLAATGSANTVTQPAAVTDAAGVATGTLASLAAELKTVSAKVDPGVGEVDLTTTPVVELSWPLGSTYYVRATGSDADAGTSPAAAFLTIGQAASVVAAGDTVYVGAGTYTESVAITTDGTAPSPVSFVADTTGARTGDAGAVVVDGGGAASTFQVDGADYVVIEGFTIIGSAGTGASGAVRVGPTASTDVTIRGNTIYGNDKGVYVADCDAAVVESNLISNNLGAEGDGVTIVSSDNVFVRNNLIYGNARYGILVAGASLTLTAESNTLYLNGDDQVRVDDSGNSVTVQNSIVSDGLADGIELQAPSTATSTYNDVWNSAAADYNGLAAGVGDLSADPAFVDADGADDMLGGAQGADDEFHLDDGVPSPAIDAGSAAADTLTLSTGLTFADCTTRSDGVLDGGAPDGATVNVGYHYQAPADDLGTLATDDARLFYGEGSLRPPRIRTWDDGTTSWLAEGVAPPADVDIHWIVSAISPLDNDEELVAVMCDTGGGTDLVLLEWTGEEWSRAWSSTAIAGANNHRRGFDVAFEAASGQALAVYSDDSATPVYRTRVDGEWSAEASLPLNDGGGPDPDPNTGTVFWVELASRPGTDEVALAYVDANDDLVAIVWDGDQWVTASATALETNVKTNPVSGEVDNRAFDLAYETLGGDLVVAWARRTTVGFWYSVLAPGETTFPVAAHIPGAPSSGIPHFVDLAPEPNGDYIAGGFFDMGDGTERLGLATWIGSGWLDPAEYDSQTWNVNDTATGDFHGGVGWVGTSGTAVCLYSDDNTGAIDWASWTLAGGWTIEADVAVAGKGFTESVQLESFPGQALLMGVFTDTNSDLWAATCDGLTWTLTNGGVALETGVSTVDSKPFHLDFHD